MVSMSIVMLFCTLSIFFLFFTCSQSVSVDYYDDKTLEEQDKTYTNESVERRFAITKSLKSTETSIVIERVTSNKEHVFNVSSINQSISDSRLHSSTDNIGKIVFDDYLYIYDDTIESNVLRQENTSISQIQTNETTSQHKYKDQYIQFYNLEPAADKDILRYIPNSTVDENVWYVPESYPCWELPLLYGELGQRKQTSKVFLIFSGRLKNVRDPGINETNDNKVHAPVNHDYNHWCGVQPCYGDHTLCLFPSNGLSTLCEKGYKVKVPTIIDQIALVNTINSMRNRVASGESDRYSHLPPAANMNEITYDYDLQKVSETWLRQCLPGPAPCSALDGYSVSQLECMKHADYCCKRSQSAYRCTPKTECFVSPIIGCLHVWFWSAGKNIELADVSCGRTYVKNYNTIQLLWAKTIKIGCAYAERANGDIRVVCNFAPGAPFFLDTKLYCGIISHAPNIIDKKDKLQNQFMSYLSVSWNDIDGEEIDNAFGYVKVMDTANTVWGVQSLSKIYEEGWVRQYLGERKNGTKGMIARLVTKYTFVDESGARCERNESMYVAGTPGSLCIDRGRRYKNLCYEFRDPTPGYRTVAVAAPIALFTLILYDLFSGVVRQSN